jgi:hypothetical protein
MKMHAQTGHLLADTIRTAWLGSAYLAAVCLCWMMRDRCSPFDVWCWIMAGESSYAVRSTAGWIFMAFFGHALFSYLRTLSFLDMGSTSGKDAE